MPAVDPFLPFNDFVKSLQNKATSKSVTRSRTTPVSETTVETMRTYLVQYYRKATAVHSFVDEDQQVWDCLPIEKQPSLMGRKDTRFKRAPEYPGELPTAKQHNKVTSFTSIKSKDVFGNQRICPEGFIPVRRLTLEELSNYKNIKQFHRKSAYGLKQVTNHSGRSLSINKDEEMHKYVYAKHLVLNKGGGCTLNLWQPVIQNNLQIFSLSQLWTVGGRNSGTQTVEVGWTVNPSRFRTNKSVLFIYWTADNYGKTGSYNLEQGDTFVQRDNSWQLGGALSPVSSAGGAQIDLRIDWYLIDTAWWLYISGKPVGYYPKRLFGDGMLSKMADAIVVGGEVSGDNSWAPMGSGSFAHKGYGKAAYIRNINYVDGDGIMLPLQLTPVSPANRCYNYQKSETSGWGSSFFYGGPGGNQC
jgi:hypothetical protein